MDSMDSALWLSEYITDENIISTDHNLQTDVRQLIHTPPNPNSSPTILEEQTQENNTRTSQQPRTTFSPDQIKVLRSWLNSHISYPYPGTEDVLHLSELTSLSQEQVSRWFTNQRARKGRLNLKSSRYRDTEHKASFQTSLGSPSVTEALFARHASSTARSTASQSTHQSTSDLSNAALARSIQPEQRTPLEAYLASPTEAEAINESVIRNASNSPDYQEDAIALNRSLSQSSSQISFTQPSSYLGLDFRSHLLLPGPAIALERPRKQGRKRGIWGSAPSTDGLSHKRGRVNPTSVPPDTGHASEPVFFCTFTGCHKELTSKTWKRHEETKHAQRQQWVCLRGGFRIQPTPSSPPQCVFCGIINPEDNHGSSCHRISDCLHRKASDRTYLRKDHLKQHVKNFHNSIFTDSMEIWKEERTTDETPWPCGFCGETLAGWDARALHISKHFRNGAHIRNWNPNLRRSPAISHMPSTSTFDQYFDYPYPASTPTNPANAPTPNQLNNRKPSRPDLILDIPEMTNPHSPSPVERFDVITPTDPTTIHAAPRNLGNHRMLLNSPQFNTSLQGSPTSAHRHWTSPSPSTPYITFTTDALQSPFQMKELGYMTYFLG